MHKDRFMHSTLSAVLAVIVLIAHPLLGRALDERPQLREYASQGDHFACSVPAGWTEYQPGFGLSQEERKVYGITLFGPSDGSPVPPTLSLHYYAPGNLVHRSMDRFIRTHSQPVLGSPSRGDSYGEVRTAVIAGRQARTFERTNVRYVGKRSLNPATVTLFEYFAVIPDDRDQGFYVLELSVPDGSRSRYAGTFDAVVKSFRPGR